MCHSLWGCKDPDMTGSSKEPQQRQPEGGSSKGPRWGGETYTLSSDCTLWKARPHLPLPPLAAPGVACQKRVGTGESRTVVLHAPHPQPSSAVAAPQQHTLFFPRSWVKIQPPEGRAGTATVVHQATTSLCLDVLPSWASALHAAAMNGQLCSGPMQVLCH